MILNKIFAQSLEVSGNKIEGPLKGPGGTDISSLADIISIVLPIIIGLGGIILFFVLVLGGIGIMTSAGNPEKLKAASAKITSSLIGFVLLALSYVIINFVSKIFGLGTGLF